MWETEDTELLSTSQGGSSQLRSPLSTKCTLGFEDLKECLLVFLYEPGIMAQTCDPSTLEIESGRQQSSRSICIYTYIYACIYM